jgi:hypothetical protein
MKSVCEGAKRGGIPPSDIEGRNIGSRTHEASEGLDTESTVIPLVKNESSCWTKYRERKSKRVQSQARMRDGAKAKPKRRERVSTRFTY